MSGVHYAMLRSRKDLYVEMQKGEIGLPRMGIYLSEIRGERSRTDRRAD